MWVVERPKTVCVECGWIARDGVGGEKALCGALTSTEGFSTVTGKEKFRFPYRYCEAANNGNCPEFKPRPDPC